MKKLLLFYLCLVALCTQGYAQNRTITGTVTAKEDGLPIPGATVKLKGSSKGTQTSSSGTYSLSVPENAVLVFSFIGYNNLEIPVNEKSIVNAVLVSDNKQLSEVVVTALGIRKEKRSIGYAEQSVNSDALIASGQTDALNALNGKVAGASITSSSGTPGAAVYIQLRGQNSITGNNQPLFVIDGVPIDNSNNQTNISTQSNTSGFASTTAQSTNRGTDINPDDIENVSVLKGPAAAALYGNLASNGAIIITTKKGKAGKTQVDFSTGVSVSSVNRLPKLQNQWVRGEDGQFVNSNSTDRYSWGSKVDTIGWDGNANSYDRHGNIVGKSSGQIKTPFQAYDNLGTFFRNATSFDNSVAVSGGNEVATYRTSVTNSYQNSIIPTEYFERTNVSFSGQLQMSKRLKASTSISYTSSDGNQPQTGSNLSGIMLGLTRTPISFDNSNGLKDPAHNPLSYTLPFPETNLSGDVGRNYRNSDTYDNPYWTINNNPYTSVVGRLIGNVQLDYNIGNGFSALYRLGSDSYQDNRHQYYEIGSGGNTGGEIIDDRYTYRSLNSDLILAYTKKLSSDFQFDGKVGNNFYGYKTNELGTFGTGLISPGFDNIANASTVAAINNITTYRTASVYYDLSVDYKSMLYLETTGRNDWASSLPKGKNAFFYPSVNLSFVFTELGDLKNSHVLSFGKIRASFSQVGQAPSPFQTNSGFVTTTYLDGFTTGNSYPINGQSSYSLNSNLPNPDLKPEKTSQTEIGTQLQFFGNRLGLDATVYYSKGSNLIFNRAIASTSAYATETVNSATMQNKGLEIQLNGTPIKSKDFTWSSFVNFALNRNKVLSLANGQNSLFLAGFGGGETEVAAVVGQPLGVLYSYGKTYVGKQEVISDAPGNGVGSYYPLSNTGVTKVTGNPNAKFKLSFGNTFNYKKLSLYGLVDWKYKGDIWNGTRGSLAAIGTSDATNNRYTNTVFQGVLGHINAAGQLVHYAADGVTEVAGPGAVNTHAVELSQEWYQGDGGGFGVDDEQFIEDGSYIKLRELTLAYDFKDLLFGKNSTVVRGLTIGAFARNIIIWTPYKGIDPETSLNGASGYNGMDYFNNPGTKTFGINAKVKF
ncbi:SusC/RagA family TonB-linked outer membrane protein [Mucilaginibacter jinjuensis]|uniref:SusC/RagA family TonB-linked outer membrane protein n=1 Tax=Mucilaginibacter jinjuensis TaxID=1176721 RepID=A0ABY7T7U7_9SPHI|nr:SusC/RagA family TonB-linked outer membrane protein [Mucilaginibacter jinjuensis]WCT12431.1 SusC/RagA family TonB-linked outer membrane protein [Mucilaginibacter jinjuensis]